MGHWAIDGWTREVVDNWFDCLLPQLLKRDGLDFPIQKDDIKALTVAAFLFGKDKQLNELYDPRYGNKTSLN